MIDGKTILAIIPARGGSKGVPRKNIRQVGGKPLIAWTIHEAKHSKYIDRLILSSEDSEIIEVAQSLGCEAPFVRPAELARDDTPGIDPVIHAIDYFPKYDIVVLLQPTSPLRNTADIDGCIKYFASKHANVCVSVTASKENPYWMYKFGNLGTLQAVTHPDTMPARRRQDLPAIYLLNGAVYVANCSWLREQKNFLSEETLGYVMPRERSLDIDTEEDLEQFNTQCNELQNAHL
jgi:CMP-N,N'-diacetyllegionaminic acid synthase